MNNEIKKEIDNLIFQFSILSQGRNMWIENEYFKIYIRKSKRLLENNLLNCLDIASIEVFDKYKRKGIFNLIVHQLIMLNENIYIESIMNPVVCDVLEKLNFKFLSHAPNCNMYILKK